MPRLLQSPWFVAFLGCILYLATTVYVLNPSKFAGAQFAKPDYSAEDDPSWKFRNPEFDQWVAQIKAEKETLNLREQHLDELQTRLNAEMQEITTVTQAVSVLQSNFDQDVVRFKTSEVDNVKHQAKLMSAMSPEGAVAMLEQMPDDEALRILFTMKNDEASVVLDTWSKAGKTEAKRAAVIMEKLREILPPPTATAANP